MRVPPIAMLHHVSDNAAWHDLKPYCIQKSTFLKLLDTLERAEKKALSLENFLKAPTKNTIILSFDDGAKHLLNWAIPQLIERGMSASFYIPTSNLGGVNTWDIVQGRSEVQLMEADDLKTLRKMGMEVGGHSHEHIELSATGNTEILRNLTRSKEILEDIIGEHITSMAWPFGDTPANADELLSMSGYTHGLSIFSRRNTAGSLRRFIVHDQDSSRSLRFKFGTGYRVYRTILDRRK